VADQNDRTAHRVDCSLRVLLVVGVRSLGRLRHRHLVAIILEDVSDPLPAGAIREGTVDEDDARLGLNCHLLASLQQKRESPKAIPWPKSLQNLEDEAGIDLDDPGVSVEVSL